jgi:hypothetical protein
MFLKCGLLGFVMLVALSFTGVAAQELPTGAIQPAPESYPDIPAVHWADDAVRRMTALGVFTGYPDGTFDGTGLATRYELAVVAARLVDLLGGSLAQLVSDPDFQRAVEDAAGNNARLIRLEAVAGNAANAAYVQELSDRIAEVEEYLNRVAGERIFPGQQAAGDGAPLHALDAAGPLDERVIASITSQLDRQIEAQEAAEALNGRQPVTTLPAAGSHRLWLGISGGYPQVSTLHFGIRDLAANLHLRFGAGYALPGALNLELHALYEFSSFLQGNPASFYLAAGPAARVGTSSSAASISVVGGLEYLLEAGSGPGSLFIELGPMIDILPVAGDIGFTARAGLNYRF